MLLLLLPVSSFVPHVHGCFNDAFGLEATRLITRLAFLPRSCRMTSVLFNSYGVKTRIFDAQSACFRTGNLQACADCRSVQENVKSVRSESRGADLMWPLAARRGNFGGFTSKFNVLPFKHDSIYYNDVNK